VEPPLVELLTILVLVFIAITIVLMARLRRARIQSEALQNRIVDLNIREKLLQVQASHDDLTGLGNRTLLADRFFFSVERAKRNEKPFAILMIDLNDFKSVNDEYGHAAGDSVLVITARRLVDAVRASDTVSRLGGDEFVLVMESFEDMKDLVHIGRKLIETLSAEITLETGERVKVGASVGFALYPNDGTDMNDLLHVADKSMYDCKSSGLMGLR
jgi:diguanylate cyclase (GGDEF)-like protein